MRLSIINLLVGAWCMFDAGKYVMLHDSGNVSFNLILGFLNLTFVLIDLNRD